MCQHGFWQWFDGTQTASYFLGQCWPRSPNCRISIPGPQFNKKMPSYQYKKSHRGDKTVVRLYYLHNGISYLGKMVSLYWIRAQAAIIQTQMSKTNWISWFQSQFYKRIVIIIHRENLHFGTAPYHSGFSSISTILLNIVYGNSHCMFLSWAVWIINTRVMGITVYYFMASSYKDLSLLIILFSTQETTYITNLYEWLQNIIFSRHPIWWCSACGLGYIWEALCP